MKRLGIGVGLKVGGASGINWSSYWATLISATVENAAPTDVVLTFPSEGTSVATDITCTVNGVARTVSSASWTGAVWTVVLASAIEYGDVVIMTFRLTNTKTVTNNVLTYAALLTSVNTGVGVSTLSMTVSDDITVTLGANAKFYSNSGGTDDESATWTITSGGLRTIYLKCTTGTATMTFSNASKVTQWGNSAVAGWLSPANAPRMTITIGKFPLTSLRVDGTSTILGAPPAGLTYLRMLSNDVTWSYSGALPTGLTNCRIESPLIAWVYGGAIPQALTYFRIYGITTNFTGLDISGTGNITNLDLIDFRLVAMSSADMVTLLTSLTNRVGTLPATITINDYADYAAPPQAVVDAVAALKLAKSITTVNLGA